MASGALGAQDRKVVICGGGIVGTCLAYYLSLRDVASTVVERHKVAGAASGKAAGFLALDWNDNSPVGELSRLSFRLHEQLAETFGKETDYRRVSALGIATSVAATRDHDLKTPDWIDGNVLGAQVIGTEETCAQVHPYKLTTALMDASKQRGTSVVTGCVQGLGWIDMGSSTRTAKGALVDGELLEADVVVIAMGPWTNKAAEWIPVPPVAAKKYHSLTVKPQEDVSAHAIFLNHISLDGRQSEPEIYPRPDGEVYLCGEPQSIPLPDNPADVFVDTTLCRNIQRATAEAASVFREVSLSSSPTSNVSFQSEIQGTRSCYLPLSPDGVPIIGKVPHTENVYIATGHSCWGILNGPATGLILSEMLVDGTCTSISSTPFDPGRFVTSR